MSRSEVSEIFGELFFFFFTCPAAVFFKIIQPFFWHRDRGVKFSPRSENCARRAKTPLPPKLRPEDLGGPRHRREDGAARRRPGPPSIFTLPIRQRDSTISWSGWGGAGGRGGRSPSPPAPGKGREAGLCLGAARRRPALPPASLPRLPASPRGTACPNMFEDEVFSARRHVCVLIVNRGRGTSA